MTFRYVNKIRLGDDFQIRKQNLTWRCLLDMIRLGDDFQNKKIRLGDEFQIRKQNSTWI